MNSPRAARKPADSAAALPKLRRKRIPRTRRSVFTSPRTTAQEPSVEPSSTKIISRSYPSASATATSSPCNAARLSTSLNSGMTTESMTGGRKSEVGCRRSECQTPS